MDCIEDDLERDCVCEVWKNNRKKKNDTKRRRRREKTENSGKSSYTTTIRQNAAVLLWPVYAYSRPHNGSVLYIGDLKNSEYKTKARITNLLKHVNEPHTNNLRTDVSEIEIADTQKVCTQQQ